MPFAAIVQANDPTWEGALREFPHHDFHHLPTYVQLEGGRRGGRANAFIYRDGPAIMLVPFVLSPVPLTLQPRRILQSDALSPYGYAGPLVNMPGGEAEQNAFVAAGLIRLKEMLYERAVCSIFIRFHPLIVPPLAAFKAMGTLVLHGETVWADLHKTEAEMWAETRRDFRNPINRMQREGYTFELDPAGRRMADFVRLYHETMRRVGASPEYFFPERYFRELQQSLGAKFNLAYVLNPAKEVISSGVFTSCTGIVQYHLSGNSLGNDGSHASKLLLHGVRQWGHAQGCDKLHLGGGVGAQKDNLFLFKSGLAEGRAPFYSWRLIVDENICRGLCDQWEKLNQERTDGPEGFFPPYRKPAALYRNIAHRSE